MFQPPHVSTFTDPDSLRAAFVRQARSYEGVRYLHQHSDRAVGVDCIGLVMAVARDFGCRFNLQRDDLNYSWADPNGYHLVERLRTEMVELADWRAALPADVLVMRWHRRRPPQHCGIVTVNEPALVECVHASRKAGRVSTVRWDMLNLITHAFRVAELAALEGLT